MTDPKDQKPDVTELTRRLEALEGALAEARRERDELRDALLQMPTMIALLRGKDHVFELANQPYLDTVGRNEDILGKPTREVLPELVQQGFLDLADRVLETGETFIGARVPADLDRTGTGKLERRWYTLQYIARRGGDGEIIGILVHLIDLTDEMLTIAAQQRAIRELSTPLIPLAEGIVLMPLVGTVDSERAGEIMETLLQGITAKQARVAILDVTGVRVVDSHVANALVKTAHAANLLGTEVVLTGIRPEVAQALVEIGADLGSLTTRGSLQSAVAYAMGKSASHGLKPDRDRG